MPFGGCFDPTSSLNFEPNLSMGNSAVSDCWKEAELYNSVVCSDSYPHFVMVAGPWALCSLPSTCASNVNLVKTK